MKVLIISDTHGADENLEKILDIEGRFDALIHLGDIEGSERKISDMMGGACDLYMIKGNNDFFSYLPQELEICLGNYKILLTHGNLYSVSLGVEQLRKDAFARGFDIAMFGHTHKPYFENENGFIMLNPGSLSYPRQIGRKCSYAIMNIDKTGNARFTQNYIEG